LYHLSSAALPAILIGLVLLGEIARLHDRPRPAGVAARRAGVALGAALVGAAIAEPMGGVSSRIAALARGEERPSSLVAHAHPALPRAGDVYVPPATEELVSFVRRETSERDPIFCRVGFMTGAEIYFLADRRDPTRFDMLAEILTTGE